VAGSRLRTRRRRIWTGVLAAAAMSVLGITLLPRFLRANLDPSLYVVVPFGHREGAAPKLITGDRCESLMLASFGRWEDVRWVDDLRVHDLRSRLRMDSLTLDAALDLARELGSGQLVWGDVAQFGDTIEVRAALYDVHHGTALRRHAANLKLLREAREGEGNALLNTTAFFAGRAFAAGVFEETEEKLKQELLDIVTKEWKSPHDERPMDYETWIERERRIRQGLLAGTVAGACCN